MEISKSARLYMERKLKKLYPTLRSPNPRINLSANPVNTLPLEPQQYNPKYLFRSNAVDGGETKEWPNP